jgi:hypothetical protein
MKPLSLHSVDEMSAVWGKVAIDLKLPIIRPNSLVGVVSRLRAGRPGIDSRQSLTFFSPRHRVHTLSGAHPASYPVGIGDSFPRGKVARAWTWPLTCI